MVRQIQEHILLIGDLQQQVQPALAQALPSAQITSVPTIFDGIAELADTSYTTVIAAAEPIERRPETAVQALRQLLGDRRLLLFGHPSLEHLCRKMMEIGCDDYLISPPTAAEIQHTLSQPLLRASSTPAQTMPDEPEKPIAPTMPLMADPSIAHLPLTEIFLDALLQHPGTSPAAAVEQLNTHLGPSLRLAYTPIGKPAPTVPEGSLMLSQTIRLNNQDIANLNLILPQSEDPIRAQQTGQSIALLLTKLIALQERHNQLQKLAITDDLTGVYNGRYFRHFLARILERAKARRFPVTLFLFDIDNFKQYNEKFGHAAGDEILQQTAALMRRCSRDHDLVARLSGGGDEFAVVFWEKEGPRQPRDPATGPSRPPQTPLQILERFRRMLAKHLFPSLGPTGQGTLTISGGLAVYPYDATDIDALIRAADHALMFGAKQSGKNSIFLVGDEKHLQSPPPENY